MVAWAGAAGVDAAGPSGAHAVATGGAAGARSVAGGEQAKVAKATPRNPIREWCPERFMPALHRASRPDRDTARHGCACERARVPYRA